MIWITTAVVLLTLIAAMAVVLLDSPLAVVAASSAVSLGVSVLFMLLRAPDVALTEAAVGAGLSGLVLALSMRRLGLARLSATSATENRHA